MNHGNTLLINKFDFIFKLQLEFFKNQSDGKAIIDNFKDLLINLKEEVPFLLSILAGKILLMLGSFFLFLNLISLVLYYKFYIPFTLLTHNLFIGGYATRYETSLQNF